MRKAQCRLNLVKINQTTFKRRKGAERRATSLANAIRHITWIEYYFLITKGIVMPKFKAKQKRVQTVIQLCWEEFDTEDEDQWESLKERVESQGADDLSELPDEPPRDPNIWFQLFQKLSSMEYENAEDDYWVSDIKGFTEYTYELIDSDDNVIDSA